MEYIYACMLIHKAGSQVKEENLKKVLEAAGVKTDENKVKATVAALKDVNIDEAIKEAASMQISAPTAPATQEKKEEVKEAKKEVKEAAAGLGSLFG